MGVKRQIGVLDREVSHKPHIADTAIWPWYGCLVLNRVYEAAEFLQAHEYENVMRWAKEIDERPAVKRGRMVNSVFGEPENQLRERHDASDFEHRTWDKIGDED